MNRIPPIEVRRTLRKEVGFGCPVHGCCNPYLSWHHFDPPWSKKQHHNPAGMIALCPEHHAKADVGSFTKTQLRELKNNINSEKVIRGNFDWMRNKILAVVGGNFYYETPIIFQFKGIPTIWFNRDEKGYMLLNVRMLSTSSEPRVHIEDNFWLSQGRPEDLESPPSGKLLRVKYSNGDELKIEFIEFNSFESIKKRYPDVDTEDWDIPYPITAIEIFEKVGGTNFEFGPRETAIDGMFLKNNFTRNCGVGLSIN